MSSGPDRFPQSQQPFTQETYHRFLRKMKTHYGDDLGVGLAGLNGIGYKFYNIQQYDHDRAAWKVLLQEYPMFSYAYISIARSYAKEGNKAAAIESYQLARLGLSDNSFYSEEQKKALTAEIDGEINALQN